MKVELTPCYILHSRDYRESSLILEIFSREFGRISLVAKGAKRNKKRQAINYNLYQKYLVSWVSKSELGTLIDIDLDNLMKSFKPGQIMTGFYMNEVILRLLHKHESHPELFDSYDSTISKLLNDEPEQTLLRYYEKTLLRSLGYGVILDHDVQTGEPINAEEDYFYVFDFGPSIETHNTSPGIKISGKTLLELNTETLSDARNINEAKLFFRSILNQHFGNKPLASRQLYQAYIQNKKNV
ncbi:MAG: DNA repair protein RecO [Proteobacteria bacterium]|nr:DNA repair protein RecO [Pseudomonadota bacterium]